MVNLTTELKDVIEREGQSIAGGKTSSSAMAETPREACFVFYNVQLCLQNHENAFLSHPMAHQGQYKRYI